MTDPIRTPAEAREASAEFVLSHPNMKPWETSQRIRALASRIAALDDEALARAAAAEAEAGKLREALRSIDGMVQEATRAPANAERWLDRIEECARAALEAEAVTAPRLCPHCLGTGQSHSVALVDRADGSASVVAEMPCLTCSNGWVSERHLHAIQRGQEMRRWRVDAGRSLREEAARLGMSATRLSALERGDDVEMYG